MSKKKKYPYLPSWLEKGLRKEAIKQGMKFENFLFLLLYQAFVKIEHPKGGKEG